MASYELDYQQVADALALGEDVVAVHYSCEAFYDAKDHPPAIAVIAIYDLRRDEMDSFSRSDLPAREGVDPELDVIERFYAAMEGHQESIVLHWNMDRPEFGFGAIAKRYRYLKNDQAASAPRFTRRMDVDALVASRFGASYAPHGKLESTAAMNRLDMRSFISGKDEVALFKDSEWATLGRSTASKAKIIAQIARLLTAGQLKTSFSVGQLRFAGATVDAVSTVLQIAERYRKVQRSLSKHPHGGSVVPFANEWDDQYMFRALLSLFFDDIRDEDPVQTTAGSGSRIDFVLPDYQLALELKHSRSSLNDAELGSQIATDLQRYAARRDITHVIFLIFDYEGITRNPRGLEKDFQAEYSSAERSVTIRIYDS